MGTYNISPDELLDPLREFLNVQEGDVSAESLAEAWNPLALEEGWHDRLGHRETDEYWHCDECPMNCTMTYNGVGAPDACPRSGLSHTPKWRRS